jgi:hypothetical protein
MAQFTLATSEVLGIINLTESLFPGSNLEPIKNIFANCEIQGNVTFTKQLEKSALVLNVSITK